MTMTIIMIMMIIQAKKHDQHLLTCPIAPRAEKQCKDHLRDLKNWSDILDTFWFTKVFWWFSPNFIDNLSPFFFDNFHHLFDQVWVHLHICDHFLNGLLFVRKGSIEQIVANLKKNVAVKKKIRIVMFVIFTINLLSFLFLFVCDLSLPHLHRLSHCQKSSFLLCRSSLCKGWRFEPTRWHLWKFYVILS